MLSRIDSHVHIMPPWRLKALARWIIKSYPNHPVREDITAVEVVEQLRELGVAHFFNFIYPLSDEETVSLNQFNLTFCQRTPGAIPFASMHPDTQDKAGYAEQLLALNRFAGFKFHPFVQRFDPWDRRMSDLYDFLQDASCPVILHTGFEQFYRMKMPVSELAGLVKRYPRLPLVFVHMAFPDVQTCFDLMADYPELYLDATNVPALLRPEFKALIKTIPRGHRVIDQLVTGLEKFSDRIMFGSDHPVGMGALADIYQDLEDLSLSTAAKENLRTNSARAFIDRFLPAYNWGNSLT